MEKGTLKGVLFLFPFLKHNFVFYSFQIFKVNSVIAFTMLRKELWPFNNVSVYFFKPQINFINLFTRFGFKSQMMQRPWLSSVNDFILKFFSWRIDTEKQ